MAAIDSLVGDMGASLKMRRPNDWYVLVHRVEIKDDAVLYSCSGDGVSPEEAIKDTFRRMISAKCLVKDTMSGTKRREVYWSGYMWQDKK